MNKKGQKKDYGMRSQLAIGLTNHRKVMLYQSRAKFTRMDNTASYIEASLYDDLQDFNEPV